MNLRLPRTAVLLDPHPIWLGAVEGIVATLGVEVVAKATEPDAALGVIAEKRPDLFITEIEIDGNGRDGPAIVRAALDRAPGVKVVVLSAVHALESIHEALGSGAAAYVVKTAYGDDLKAAIRQAFERSVYLARGGIMELIGPRPSRESEKLTGREQEILRLVAEGRSNADLARQLWLSEQTIKVHLSNIYRKLGVANRTEASRWAQLNGLLAEPETSPTAYAVAK